MLRAAVGVLPKNSQRKEWGTLFKSTHRSGKDVVALDPNLDPHEVRHWSDRNQLLCPGCREGVIYRRGEINRPHFAHRVDKGCKYDPGDAELAAARAVLYEFFRSKAVAWPKEKGAPPTVDLEVSVPKAREGNLLDVLVRWPGGKPVAYRILKAGRSAALMEEDQYATTRGGYVPRFLLLASRRNMAEAVNPPALVISSRDHHCCFYRPWDRYHSKPDREQRYNSIAYLDPDQKHLYLYRHLTQARRLDGEGKHPMYHFKQEHQAPLAEVLVLKGELIFPDERGIKAKWDDEKAELKRQKEELARLERERLVTLPSNTLPSLRPRSVTASAGSPVKRDDQPKPLANVIPTSSWRLETPQPVVTPKRPAVTLSEEITCASCGQPTRDWWNNSPGECNACKFKKRGMEPQICSVCKCAYPPKYLMVEGRCQSCR